MNVEVKINVLMFVYLLQIVQLSNVLTYLKSINKFWKVSCNANLSLHIKDGYYTTLCRFDILNKKEKKSYIFFVLK